jgi:hypothetical protein
VTLNVALSAPTNEGVKVMLYVQVEVPASGLVQVVDAIAKSPGLAPPKAVPAMLNEEDK